MNADSDARPVEVADEAELDALRERTDRLLVEFYTEGCSACAAMEPVLGGVARRVDATVATCNPRDDPPLVERYDVQSVPTLVLFRNGEPVARLADGFQGVDAIVNFVESNA